MKRWYIRRIVAMTVGLLTVRQLAVPMLAEK